MVKSSGSHQALSRTRKSSSSIGLPSAARSGASPGTPGGRPGRRPDAGTSGVQDASLLLLELGVAQQTLGLELAQLLELGQLVVHGRGRRRLRFRLRVQRLLRQLIMLIPSGVVTRGSRPRWRCLRPAPCGPGPEANRASCRPPSVGCRDSSLDGFVSSSAAERSSIGIGPAATSARPARCRAATKGAAHRFS